MTDINELLLKRARAYKEIEMDLLRGNFTPKAVVTPEAAANDPKAEYRKKALESICGSMVFVEREMLIWDSKKS